MNVLNSLKEVLKVSTNLFRNSLLDISDEESNRTFSDNTNSFNYVFGHTIGARFFMASLLGYKSEFKFASLYHGSEKPFSSEEKYPVLSELKSEFERITIELINILETVSDEALADSLPVEFPYVENNSLSGVSFLAQHESYHIGQLGFLRKLLTKTAISYQPTEA